MASLSIAAYQVFRKEFDVFLFNDYQKSVSARGFW